MTPSADARPFRIAILTGAGGGVPDLRAFAATPSEAAYFTPVAYRGWRRYVDEGFCGQVLVQDLTDEIAAWKARVGIVGISIGGHLGYAVALRLQSLGVDVTGFCAVDSFMIQTADVRPGATGRHLARLRALARTGSPGKLAKQFRSLFWRALLRMAGGRAAPLLRRWRDSSLLRGASVVDPTLEVELDVRMLLRALAPWLRDLDRDAVPLQVRATHLRTAAVAGSDQAWRARCPAIDVVEIAGDHDSIFDPENFAEMRGAIALATRGWR